MANLKELFSKEISRSYFGKYLFQQKFNENKNQVLCSTAFNNLVEMIVSSLKSAECNKEEFDSIKLITKSLFFYYK